MNSLSDRIYADWVYFHDILLHNIQIFADKKRDKYIVKKNIIQPKGGIQRRLFPLPIEKELSSFGGFTSLRDIEKLNGIVACSRKYRNIVFKCILYNNSLEDVVEEN